MARIIPSIFCDVQFYNTEEMEQASILSEPQKLWIQYNISKYATEKLALRFDPTNPQNFVQREAELQGSINVLLYLIDSSDAVERAAKEKILAQNSGN